MSHLDHIYLYIHIYGHCIYCIYTHKHFLAMKKLYYFQTMKSLAWIIIITLMTILYCPFGIFINLMQGISYLLLKPVLSNEKYTKLCLKFNDIIAFIMMPLVAGIQIQLYTDEETYKLLGKENAIMMPNHKNGLDYVILTHLAEHFISPASSISISKDSAKYFPIMGWAGLFCGSIYLKRDWSRDKNILNVSLEALKNFPQIFWLIFFVEGTRFTSQKLVYAQQYAVSNNLPVPKNVLVPRVKGIVYSVKKMRSYVPAVYDVTIVVPQNQPRPSLLTIMWGKPAVVKIHIKRFSSKDLPESDEDLAKWCRDRFVVKDNLLEKFMTEGTFNNGQRYNIHRKKPYMAAIYWAFGFLVTYVVCYKFSILCSWQGIKSAAAFLTPIFTIIFYFFSTIF